MRMPGSHCRALVTPRPLLSIIQTAQYETVWNRPITSVSKISEAWTQALTQRWRLQLLSESTANTSNSMARITVLACAS